MKNADEQVLQEFIFDEGVRYVSFESTLKFPPFSPIFRESITLPGNVSDTRMVTPMSEYTGVVESESVSALGSIL